MTDIKGLLIDLGGVVYNATTPLPGALKAIDRLQQGGFGLRFLTNTTSKPLKTIHDQLLAFGLEAKRETIFTPAIAARTYIEKHGLKPHFLMRHDLYEDFRNLNEGTKPAVVVGDAGDGFTYGALNDAYRRIEQGAELIALAANRKFVDADGELSLDVGAFIVALEYATGQTATVLGKPSADFFHMAVADLGLPPDQVAMVGDDAEFDSSAAVKAGLKGYLVRTGKWQPGAEVNLDPPPSAIFDDLAAVADFLLAA